MASLRRVFVFSVSRIVNSTLTPTRFSDAVLRSQNNFSRPCIGSNSRLFSSNDGVQSLAVDFSNEESKRRLLNRLVYRSKQRGYLELDLILGKWVEDNIRSLDEKGIQALVHVLDLENPDLWKWLTGQEQPPEAINTNLVFNAVRSKVMNNLDSHASPETRATPGQPWVRGWDDFKKGRDAPIVGNQ